MRQLSERHRLVVTGATCSAIVICAGVVALQGRTGVLIASVMLTAAFIIGLVGSAYSSNRTLGWGLAALVAAGGPLFIGLYVIGVQIMTRLGAGTAGGLLIGIGGGLALASVGLYLTSRRPAAHIRR